MICAHHAFQEKFVLRWCKIYWQDVTGFFLKALTTKISKTLFQQTRKSACECVSVSMTDPIKTWVTSDWQEIRYIMKRFMTTLKNMQWCSKCLCMCGVCVGRNDQHLSFQAYREDCSHIHTFDPFLNVQRFTLVSTERKLVNMENYWQFYQSIKSGQFLSNN